MNPGPNRPIDGHRTRGVAVSQYALRRMQTFGPYTVVGTLGEGGMATVYLAEDPRHGRQVAIKVMKPDTSQHIGPERFMREIETVARLTHPHILPLYDSGT